VSAIANIAVIIVWLAIIATILAHKTSVELVDAIGNSFSGSITAAKGK
jgi:hypothetical protein